MKKISFTLGTLLMLPLIGLHAKDLRIGVDVTYPPFESKTKEGKLVGFDIDLGNAVCAQMKVKCTWVETSFDGLIPALNAKKFDLAMSAISITEDRKKVVLFSNKIFNTPAYVVSKKGTKLAANAESLRNKQVGVAQGSVFETYAKQFWQPKHVNVQVYESSDKALLDLVNGRLDAVLDDAVVVSEALLRKPEGKAFSFVQPQVFDEKIMGPGTGAAFRYGDVQLRDAFNAAFASVRSSGEYAKIAKKYFDFDVYGK